MHAVLLLLLVATAQDSSTAALERRAVTTGVLATTIPVAAGLMLASSSDDYNNQAAAGLVLTFGVLVGPVFGYGEAGISGRGWEGAALRTVTFVGGTAAAIAICGEYCSGDQEQAAMMVFRVGLLLTMASVVYDLGRLPHNIRAHEAKRRLTIAPFYSPGERRVGLGGHFTLSSRGLGR